MKVLVTGMASSHTKPSANTTFFGTLVKAVETFATVEWATPSVTWTKEFLDQYDSVLIGIIPPMSLGANKVYGAMHAINIMYDSPKLRLVVDHPQVWQFKASLASIERDVSSIFTSFYSKRREYSLAVDPKISSGIQSAAHKLLNSAWPKTIYPELPWAIGSTAADYIPTSGKGLLYPINLDALLINPEATSAEKSEIWVSDSVKSTWNTKLEKLLKFPVTSIKTSIRDTDLDVYSKIAASMGILISPQDRGVGTWWSYRYIQAINSLTPVISDWRETRLIGDSWDILGSTLEELSPAQRKQVALDQRESYINHIPEKDEAISNLQEILESK